MNSIKKLQILLCLIAGSGLFLPLYVFSSEGKSDTISFFEMFKIQSSESGSGVIDSRIVLGVIILALVLLIIRLKSDNYGLKIFSFLSCIAAGVVFYIDINKLSAIKKLLLSLMKYGIGYYMSLIGLGIIIILGIVDLFNRDYATSSVSSNYDYSNTTPVNPQVNNPNNAPVYNIQTGQMVSNNNEANNNAPMNNNSVNQVKLSDLVNRNTSSENVTPNAQPSINNVATSNEAGTNSNISVNNETNVNNNQ